MKQLFSVFLVGFLATSAFGQEGLIKTIGGAAKQKAEQQDFNTTRSNRDKGNLQEDAKKSKSAPAPAPEPTDTTKKTAVDGPSLFTKASFEEKYTFNQTVTYKMEDLKKKDESQITYHYADSTMCMVDGDGKTASVIDAPNEAMITFDEKNKTAMVMSTKWATNMAAKMAAKKDEDSTNFSVTKTGNTKVILGHKCEEYIIQTEDTKTICWYTTELSIKFAGAAMAIAKSAGTKTDFSKMDNPGMMLEMTAFNKKGEARTHMIATAYSTDQFIKALAGYSITRL